MLVSSKLAVTDLPDLPSIRRSEPASARYGIEWSSDGQYHAHEYGKSRDFKGMTSNSRIFELRAFGKLASVLAQGCVIQAPHAMTLLVGFAAPAPE